MSFSRTYKELGLNMAQTMFTSYTVTQAKYPEEAFIVMEIEHSMTPNPYDNEYDPIAVHDTALEEAQQLLLCNGIYSRVYHDKQTGAPNRILLSRSKAAPIMSVFKNATVFLSSIFLSLILFGILAKFVGINDLFLKTFVTLFYGVHFSWLIFVLMFFKHQDIRVERDSYGKILHRLRGGPISFI